MKTKNIVILAMFVLSMTMVMPKVSSNAEYTEIELTPNSYYGEWHSNLTLNISVFVTPQDGTNIGTVATDLITFTPGILRCMSIAWGNLFRDKTFVMLGTINNSAGTIKNMIWGSITPTQTPGYYVNMTFQVLSQGTGNITIVEGSTGVSYTGVPLPFLITHNFSILTEIHPYPPYNPAPSNNTAYKDVYSTWLNCSVADPNGYSMDVSFYWGNGTFIGTIDDVPNGTTAALYLPIYWHRTILGYNCTWLRHNTTYHWYAVADNGFYSTQGSLWNFHTGKAWDLNVDRQVDYLDVSSLIGHYSFRVIPPGEQPWDINEDTYTNYLDVSLLVAHYNEHY